MIIEYVQELGAWTWVIVGIALLALEIAAPGVFFIWFGLAAVVVGTLALLVAFPWQAQFILFVALASLIVVFGRRYFARSSDDSASPGLNQRGRRLIGSIAVLGEPIVDGQGRIRVDDTTWRVVGPNLPSGTRVRIASVDGALLTVEDAGKAP